MNRDDVIRMAREAGFEIDCCSLEWHDRIERFAALVAAAKCNELADEAERNGNTVLAQQLRARGQA